MVDLSLKVLEALNSKEAPVFPPLPSYEKKPEDAEFVGHLPEHLRRLNVCWRGMKGAENAEIDRRCVEFFGRKSYDNERIEYMIYNEVRSDPNFGGYESVKALLDRALRWHFPKLPVDSYDWPRYFVDEKWDVWAVPFKKEAPKLPLLPLDIVIK